ncbi:MAG: N4-gp56 family major capsid protein [Hydrogenophaga sp.]|nr:N4-gp56 family major capsid protein [Hydrogenophaga sp.]
MTQTAYGDISPRTAAYAEKELLKRGLPYLVLEKFGQAKPMPSNSTKVMKFRRYNALPSTPVALTEGVTPAGQALNVTDVTATLTQYGDKVSITDVVIDTHEDPTLNEAVNVLGEQAAQVIEKMRFGVIKAGTNVLYGNGAARTDVNTAISVTVQRRAVRALKRQNGRPITQIVRSTPAYGTENVAPGFVGLIHPDLESDVRALPGFTPAEKYGSITPWENEIGKVDEVRYVSSTVFEPWADAGGAKGAMLSTTGVNADVYPVIYLARDAFGIVALKGQYAAIPMVVNPKPSDSDPLAQRGHVAWKSMQTCVILNDAFLVRAELSATA